MSNSKVVYEGWMVRYGRRKIGRSFIHMRYFVLESRLLAYYKKKPQDNVVNFICNDYFPFICSVSNWRCWRLWVLWYELLTLYQEGSYANESFKMAAVRTLEDILLSSSYDLELPTFLIFRGKLFSISIDYNHMELILCCFSFSCGKVPTKTLLIDGNCRVEDRGLKNNHGHVR